MAAEEEPATGFRFSALESDDTPPADAPAGAYRPVSGVATLESFDIGFEPDDDSAAGAAGPARPAANASSTAGATAADSLLPPAPVVFPETETSEVIDILATEPPPPPNADDIVARFLEVYKERIRENNDGDTPPEQPESVTEELLPDDFTQSETIVTDAYRQVGNSGAIAADVPAQAATDSPPEDDNPGPTNDESFYSLARAPLYEEEDPPEGYLPPQGLQRSTLNWLAKLRSLRGRFSESGKWLQHFFRGRWPGGKNTAAEAAAALSETSGENPPKTPEAAGEKPETPAQPARAEEDEIATLIDNPVNDAAEDITAATLPLEAVGQPDAPIPETDMTETPMLETDIPETDTAETARAPEADAPQTAADDFGDWDLGNGDFDAGADAEDILGSLGNPSSAASDPSEMSARAETAVAEDGEFGGGDFWDAAAREAAALDSQTLADDADVWTTAPKSGSSAGKKEHWTTIHNTAVTPDDKMTVIPHGEKSDEEEDWTTVPNNGGDEEWAMPDGGEDFSDPGSVDIPLTGDSVPLPDAGESVALDEVLPEMPETGNDAGGGDFPGIADMAAGTPPPTDDIPVPEPDEMAADADAWDDAPADDGAWSAQLPNGYDLNNLDASGSTPLPESDFDKEDESAGGEAELPPFVARLWHFLVRLRRKIGGFARKILHRQPPEDKAAAENKDENTENAENADGAPPPANLKNTARAEKENFMVPAAPAVADMEVPSASVPLDSVPVPGADSEPLPEMDSGAAEAWQDVPPMTGAVDTAGLPGGSDGMLSLDASLDNLDGVFDANIDQPEDETAGSDTARAPFGKRLLAGMTRWGGMLYRYIDGYVDFRKNWWLLVDGTAIIIMTVATAGIIAYFIYYR